MPKDVKVSLHFLRLAWADPSHTVPEIARHFGMSTRTLHRIVKLQGWTPRTSRPRSAVLTALQVKPLWDAGLRCCDIAVILGSSTRAVQAAAWRAGWRRFKGWRPALTLDDWRQDQLAARMRETVERGRAA